MTGPWKSQPCKTDDLTTMLNELEAEGREVFTVLALSNAYALVVSRVRPKPPLVINDEFAMPKLKKGRK